MTPRINLLPWREARRARRQREYAGHAVFALILAGAAVYGGGIVLQSHIDAQEARNSFIRQENAILDQQIREIATLRAEIDDLVARKTAVESLQANRNEPVLMMTELTRHTPEGVFLRGIRQDNRRVNVTGSAQSNERVSDFLRRLANDSDLLGQPTLVEIRAVPAGGRTIYDFSLNFALRSAEPEATPAR